MKPAIEKNFKCNYNYTCFNYKYLECLKGKAIQCSLANICFGKLVFIKLIKVYNVKSKMFRYF